MTVKETYGQEITVITGIQSLIDLISSIQPSGPHGMIHVKLVPENESEYIEWKRIIQDQNDRVWADYESRTMSQL